MANEKSLRETIDNLNNKIVKYQDIEHELKQDVERVQAQVKRRDGVIAEQGEKIKKLEKDYASRLSGMDVLRECNNKLAAEKENDEFDVKETIGLLIDARNRRDEKIKDLEKENTELKAKVEYGNTGDKNTAELVTKVAKTQTKKYKNLQEERDLLREQISALMEVNRNLRKYSDAIVTEKNHKIDGLIQDKKDLMVLEEKLDWKKLGHLINAKCYIKDKSEPLPDPNGNFSDTGGDDYSDCVWEDRLTNWNNNKFQPFFYRVDLEFKKRYNETHYPIKMEELRKECTIYEYLPGPSFEASHEKQWMALRADKTNADFRELEESKELTDKQLEELTKTYNEALYKIEGLTQDLKETIRIKLLK